MKKLCVRTTKNRNPFRKQITLKESPRRKLFLPVVYLWVNLLYIVTFTKNYVLGITGVLVYHWIHNYLEVPYIFNFISLTFVVTGVFFLKYSTTNDIHSEDPLEEFIYKNSTPKTFIKFKYAKRTTKLHWKQLQYLKRKKSK